MTRHFRRSCAAACTTTCGTALAFFLAMGAGRLVGGLSFRDATLAVAKDGKLTTLVLTGASVDELRVVAEAVL